MSEPAKSDEKGASSIWYPVLAVLLSAILITQIVFLRRGSQTTTPGVQRSGAPQAGMPGTPPGGSGGPRTGPSAGPSALSSTAVDEERKERHREKIVSLLDKVRSDPNSKKDSLEQFKSKLKERGVPDLDTKMTTVGKLVDDAIKMPAEAFAKSKDKIAGEIFTTVNVGADDKGQGKHATPGPSGAPSGGPGQPGAGGPGQPGAGGPGQPGAGGPGQPGGAGGQANPPPYGGSPPAGAPAASGNPSPGANSGAAPAGGAPAAPGGPPANPGIAPQAPGGAPAPAAASSK